MGATFLELCDIREYNISSNIDSRYTSSDPGEQTGEGTSDTYEDDDISSIDSGNDNSDSYDYSVEISSIIENQETINTNIMNLHESVIVCTSLVFCVVVFLVVKVAWSILNNILGLNNI